MATKSKKFSRSRGVKVLLVLLYIICFASMGAIAGYLPAYGYMDGNCYIADSVMSDSYIESACFADKFTSDFTALRAEINEAVKYNRISEFRNKIDKYPIYVEFNYNGIGGENYVKADYIFKVNAYGVSSDKGVPDMIKAHDLNFGGFYEYVGEFITIGYTCDELNRGEFFWLETRRNMTIVLVSEIALLIVGIVLICMICSVSGEDTEGNVTFPRLCRVPYEITLLLAVIVAVPLGFVIAGLTGLNSLCYSHNGKILMMAVAGALCAVSALFLLWSFVSMFVRGKNGKIYRGSIILLVLHLFWKLLKWCAGYLMKLFRKLTRVPAFIAEIFTGEFYKAGTVARKLIFIDAVFIAATSLNLLFMFFTESIPLFFVIEIIFLALFIYGRYLICRDEAQLERQIREIYVGNYSYRPAMHKNSPYIPVSDMLSAISEQYRMGIEETVRAERTKMELVTNVSHDLKTPLTSIIGYVELLSKQNLEGEAGEYVEILQKKSERLKNIVSDVFELAKTTSGEITVERETLDLSKLSYQTLAEMEDRIAASGLEVKTSICQPPVTIISDGKRLYRVIQNLLDNALKYSLKGTRIYYSLEKHANIAYIIIKNVASYEMNFTKDEILERFTRADKARSTEGSGLGLSIAQGFTLACGGTFDIELDGDMFKVIIGFPMAAQPAETEQAVSENE